MTTPLTSKNIFQAFKEKNSCNGVHLYGFYVKPPKISRGKIQIDKRRAEEQQQNKKQVHRNISSKIKKEVIKYTD